MVAKNKFSAIDRIKQLVNEKKFKVTEIADYTGISQYKIYKWLDDKIQSSPKAEDNAILEEWLDTLEEVPENSKDRLLKLRKNFIEKSEVGTKVFESAPTPATVKTVYRDEHAVPDYVLKIPQFKDCNYGTRASGDSMYPEVRNGDLVICKELDRSARVIYGDMYVVHTKDGIETIKYVKNYDVKDDWVLLVPHNKAAGEGTPIPKEEILRLFKVRAVFKAY